MPLGDSITQGCCTNDFLLNNGYRKLLYELLSDSSGFDINFVGSEQAGDFDDIDHEGHDGWRSDEVSANVFNWLNLNPADIILLHIGTNDITPGANVSDIIINVEEILDEIDRYSTDIYVVLARIINRYDGTSQETTDFNLEIQNLADNRILLGDRITVVDQESALTYPDDVDGTHPNPGGYIKMANAWYPEIVTIITNDTSLPVQGFSISAKSFDRSIVLNWKTESEINNLGFIIERSVNDTSLFLPLASFKNNQTLAGQGNASDQSIYIYADNSVINGKIYWYRISSINYTGERNTDGVISAIPGIKTNQIRLFQNYPNPFNNLTKFSFYLPSSGKVRATVFDLHGKVVEILSDTYYSTGSYSLLWNSVNFSSGIYFYQIEKGYEHLRNKMILLK